MTELEDFVSAMSTKVWATSEVKKRVDEIRGEGKKIVQCHGVFDLLHPGHIDHLNEARKQGDVLVVSVTSDSYVNKGPGRPFYGIDLRLKMLGALEVVDAVFVSPAATAEAAIGLVRPDIFVKGPDYADLDSDITGNVRREKETVEKHGGRLYFTTGPIMSSSQLINRQAVTHSLETEEWLSVFRQSFTEAQVLKVLDSISDCRVVVVGEFISDEYVFCEALGKTNKEPVLAFLAEEKESQFGGGLAVARHVAGLGAETTFVTRVGKDRIGDLARRAASQSGIRLVDQVSETHDTIVKTRYIERSTGVKVFETYRMTDEIADSVDDLDFQKTLREEINSADVVIVCDYGHGLMSEGVIEILRDSPGVVAVNTQSNAGNRGYNSVSRYTRADIVCLNGSELTLELRRKHGKLEELIPSLGKQTKSKHIVVTRGADGVAIWTADGDLDYMPAFTERVRDRVGAGDALFAVVSLLLARKVPAAIVGLLGNLAGAAMVSDLGNRQSLSVVDLKRHVSALLK